MYTVKFFFRDIMTHPCEHRFKTLSNAKAFAKQVTNVCKEKRSSYSITISNKEKIISEEKVEY